MSWFGRDRRSEALVCVAVAENEFTAQVLRDELREAGIPSMIRNRDGVGLIVGAISGRFELFVLEGDAGLAATVLGGGPTSEALPPPRLEPGRDADRAARRARRRRWW